MYRKLYITVSSTFAYKLIHLSYVISLQTQVVFMSIATSREFVMVTDYIA